MKRIFAGVAAALLAVALFFPCSAVSASSAILLDGQTGRVLYEKNGEEYIFHDTEQDCDLKIEDIFKWENKIFHISGLMFRKKYFIRPKEFYMGKVGDYPSGIYLALQGKIRFFKDVRQ